VATEKIPFIISVTGHRDLADDEIIRCRKKVETILKYFCELKTLKHTPVWVFSSLSDGADRCVELERYYFSAPVEKYKIKDSEVIREDYSGGNK